MHGRLGRIVYALAQLKNNFLAHKVWSLGKIVIVMTTNKRRFAYVNDPRLKPGA